MFPPPIKFSPQPALVKSQLFAPPTIDELAELAVVELLPPPPINTPQAPAVLLFPPTTEANTLETVFKHPPPRVLHEEPRHILLSIPPPIFE